MDCVTSSENVLQSFTDNRMRQPVCTLKSMTPSKAHPSPDRGVVQYSDEPVTESSGHGGVDHPSSMMAGSQSGRIAISSSISLNSSSMSDTPANSMAVFTSKVAVSRSPNDLSEIQLRQPTLESKTPFRVSPQHAADKDKDEPDIESIGTMTCGSNNSSLLKIVCSQSGNSADSFPHSSAVSQKSTPTIDALLSVVAIASGCETRQSISTLKTPLQSYFQPTADEAHSDELLTASCDTGTHQNITGSVLDCEMKKVDEHEHHIGRFKAKDKTRQVPKELRSRKSSDQPVDFKRERIGSAQSNSNSEEENGDSPNVVPKVKHGCRYLPPKKEKRKNITENQSVTDKSSPLKNTAYQQNTSKTGVGGKKAKVEQQSVSVLKAKAQVHYPGYSSGWSSSSDSETKKDIVVTTQGSEERENQLSNSSSIKSTISTSSWTSSEEGDKEQQLQQKSSSKLSDIESVGCGRSVYQPGYEHNKECCEGDDNRKTTEQTQDSIPLAPDSVDMEMEPQAHEGSQRQDGTPTDVTVIPETQEVLSDIDGVSNSEVVAEQLGSPIIPMQNYLQITKQGSTSSESLPCYQENQTVHSSSIESKTAHLGLSPSDMDSHLVLPPAASDKSNNQNRRQKQKKLLEKIKKRHPRRGFSDMGDSASSADSRRIDSCLRRKVRLSAKVFQTYCMKKWSNRQKGPSIQGDEQNANNVDSSIAKCISDSEFVCPSSRRLMSLSRGDTTLQKSVSLSVDEKVERSGKRSEKAPVSTDKQLSEVSEGEPLVRVISKQKTRKVDHALSPKSVSKPSQSQSLNSNALYLKQHMVTKKANLRKRKRTAKNVIKISSDSESGDFEPPPFKKRKPCPNFLQQRKKKPTILDKIYSAEVPLKLSTKEKLRSGSEPLEKSSDSEVTCDLIVSKQRPLTVKGQYQRTTSADKEKATTQSTTFTGCSHESSDFSQSSNKSTKGRFEASAHTPNLEMDSKFSVKEGSAVTEEKKGQSTASDTSSSDSSDCDDETNCHLEKDAVDSPSQLGENRRISDPTKVAGSLNCSRTNSSRSTSSSDEEPDSDTNFYATNKLTIDKTSFIGQPLDRTAKVRKSLSSSLQRQCVDNRQKKSEETSSESSDELEGISRSSKLSFLPQPLEEVTSQQPKRSRNANTLQSSDKKFSADKSSLSETPSVRKPPRFLFSRSSVKKNVPWQLSEVKKLNNKPKGSYESENSTGKL